MSELNHSSCVCMSLRRVSRVVTQTYNQVISPIGIQGTQLIALRVCNYIGPSTINEIASMIATDRTTLSRNFKKLEKKGLLKFSVGDDARSRIVQLTDQGRAMIDKGQGPWEIVQKEFISKFGEQRWADLHKELQVVHDTLQTMQFDKK